MAKLSPSTSITNRVWRLAYQNRYAGACGPWSVAKHILLMYNMLPDDASEELKKAVLLHDLEEATLGDIIAPVKEHLPTARNYYLLEVNDRPYQATALGVTAMDIDRILNNGDYKHYDELSVFYEVHGLGDYELKRVLPGLTEFEKTRSDKELSTLHEISNYNPSETVETLLALYKKHFPNCPERS